MTVLLLETVLVFRYSLVHWLIVYCGRQQPKRETEDTSATQISPSATADSIDASQPDVVYGNIQQNTNRAPVIDDLYSNVPSKSNTEDSIAVIYSELQRRDSTWCSCSDAILPAELGLYAQQKKSLTLITVV